MEADKEYENCLIIDQDISTLYINGTALNARLCDHPGNGFALTVTDGTLEAKNTKIATKIIVNVSILSTVIQPFERYIKPFGSRLDFGVEW